ncbi:hypothetical protein GW796_09365 [archaeon]|nr:hypothetical protein [archaeon]NCT58937.1 hypothetical protein [archaeon]
MTRASRRYYRERLKSKTRYHWGEKFQDTPGVILKAINISKTYHINEERREIKKDFENV